MERRKCAEGGVEVEFVEFEETEERTENFVRVGLVFLSEAESLIEEKYISVLIQQITNNERRGGSPSASSSNTHP